MSDLKPFFLSVLFFSLILGSAYSLADDKVTYKITVTNLTPGQPLAPAMAATHRPGYKIFEVAAPPSDELAMLAEAGNGRPMADLLMSIPGVQDALVSTNGLTRPGQSTTMMITAHHDHARISIAAMLGATNDAFYAITNVALPKGRRSATYMAVAYDAGSETNDELSTTVAGLGGEGYSPNDEGEGFVHIHNGIHGIGDADPSVLDWRNPVAKIVIERVHH